jgi:hypothetical protein
MEHIIASSKYLGYIPTSLGAQDDIPWTLVDMLSIILVELLEKDYAEEGEESWTKYYHLTNPTNQSGRASSRLSKISIWPIQRQMARQMARKDMPMAVQDMKKLRQLLCKNGQASKCGEKSGTQIARVLSDYGEWGGGC